MTDAAVAVPEDVPQARDKPAILAAIETALDEIRPAIQFDGGDCELVDYDESTGVAAIRFHGACGGCPSSSATLHLGIQQVVRERVPEVQAVHNVT